MLGYRTVSGYLSLIKFSHSIFALPFALISIILAFRQESLLSFGQREGWMALWVIIAMVGARSGAMGFNRLVDRKWDRLNPRTKNRPSVTGEISPLAMLVMILISFGVLIFAAWKLNPLAFWLSPLAIFLVCFYSFTKRFTSYSHLFLGLAIGAAPVASWIAVRGEISQGSLILGLSVLLWIAGFDILYALQDQGFDQKTELHSIPVRFGVKGSLIIARILHVGTAVAWLWLAREEGLGWIFYVGLALATLLLIWEHLLVKEDDLTKVNLAFMNMNSVIGLTLFFAVVFDVYLLEKV